MIRNLLASGVAVIALFGAVACNSGVQAASPHTAAVARNQTSAPARTVVTNAGCGTEPPRRAWAQRIGPSGQVSWQVRLATDPTQQGISLRPLVIGGTAVFAEENRVYALRRADGHQLWKRVFAQTGTDQFSAMVYGLWLFRGSVIVLVGQVSSASRLYSLNAVTGATRWWRSLGKQGETGNLTLTGDGGLAMTYGYATLRVVDLATGQVRWGRTSGHSLGPLAVGGVVVAPADGQPSGRLLGFSSRTGKLLWTRTAMPSEPEPLLADGLVLISTGRAVLALSPATGRTVWTLATAHGGSPLPSGPSGIAVLTSSPDRLYLIDAKTGRVRWHVPYPGGQITLLDTGTDLLYEGSVAGRKGFSLVDLRAATGSVRWAVPAPATFSGELVRFGMYAVVIGDPASTQNEPGVLAAFRLSDGKAAWTAKVPTLVLVPMAVAGADLLVQPTDESQGCPA